MDLDVAELMEKLVDNLAPGSIVVLVGAKEDEEEIIDKSSEDWNPYDLFDVGASPGTGGGGVQDAILMDNPFQS